MKKKFNRFALIPIPFIVTMIGLLIFLEDTNETVSTVLFILIVICFYITLTLITSSNQYDSTRWFNATKIKNLDEDIYGHYAEISKQFSFVYDHVQENAIFFGETDKLRFENFIVMIVKHQRLLPLYKHFFETINHSDGKYYQLMHIYALHYLLENDITKFQIHYNLYKNTIDLRPESRVLHEKLHRIMFGKDYYDIPLFLLDTMYEHYVLDKAIDREIMNYHPKCPLDELIYITILHHYLEFTENNKLLSDIEEEYLRYKDIRKNL